jgi:hypothetical protein
MAIEIWHSGYDSCIKSWEACGGLFECFLLVPLLGSIPLSLDLIRLINLIYVGDHLRAYPPPTNFRLSSSGTADESRVGHRNDVGHSRL